MFMGYDLQSSKEWACQEERKDDLLMHTPIFTVFSLSLLPLSFSFLFFFLLVLLLLVSCYSLIVGSSSFIYGYLFLL